MSSSFAREFVFVEITIFMLMSSERDGRNPTSFMLAPLFNYCMHQSTTTQKTHISSLHIYAKVGYFISNIVTRTFVLVLSEHTISELPSTEYTLEQPKSKLPKTMRAQCCMQLSDDRSNRQTAQTSNQRAQKAIR